VSLEKFDQIWVEKENNSVWLEAGVNYEKLCAVLQENELALE
jgi:UDP-N-acetylenolpyruvoylglucosamine reductase